MKKRDFNEEFDATRFFKAVANIQKQTAIMSWEEKTNYIQPVVNFFKLRTDPSFCNLLIFVDLIFGSEEQSFRYFSQHFSETERQTAFEEHAKRYKSKNLDILARTRIALLGPAPMAAA